MRSTGILAVMAMCGLVACAGPRADNYAGEPIERVARDLGYPSQVSELPDGRRSYQWEIEQTTQVGPLRPVLRGISLSTSGGAGLGIGLERDSVSTGVCIYTLTASPVGETYIVEASPSANASCLS
ncbi:hypothetical protein SAMN06273572_11062 [Monaibacterium marinum]|uniref:Lipoprotein n=1 Tax=Pontivivens marinum TaxID=1690039 RepID=A0A2C9CVU6_9RHOB|nr:hypothetical protein [Monaibacterium marinum]SOH95388.1 hypothetical protein SAMN06273572_11062 [Monaibacterium marinum]